MTEAERFCHRVRLLQRRTKCSNYVCEQFIRVLRSEEGGFCSIKAFDKKAIAAAGVNFFVLHGCPKCDKHVYTPTDKRKNCPYKNKVDGTTCGHPRFDSANQPFEVCFVFLSGTICVLFCKSLFSAESFLLPIP